MSKQTIALAYTRPAGALEESEYQALAEALSESARGRGFLTEHARRSRSAETNILLTAIERIEAQVRPRTAAPELGLLHDELRGVLDDVRTARARIESGGAAPKAEQLAALLDILQRRLGKLLPPPPAADAPPATRPMPEIAAPAAPPRPAAGRWLDETLEPPPAVNDASPPPRPATAERETGMPRISPTAAIKPGAPPVPVFEIEAEIKAVVAAEVESRIKTQPTTVAQTDKTADDLLTAIMALSEDERIALFT